MKPLIIILGVFVDVQRFSIVLEDKLEFLISQWLWLLIFHIIKGNISLIR